MSPVYLTVCLSGVLLVCSNSSWNWNENLLTLIVAVSS